MAVFEKYYLNFSNFVVRSLCPLIFSKKVSTPINFDPSIRGGEGKAEEDSELSNGEIEREGSKKTDYCGILSRD